MTRRSPTTTAHKGTSYGNAASQWVRTPFGELTRELASTVPVNDPDTLADQLALMMKGVYSSVQTLGIDGPTKAGTNPRRGDTPHPWDPRQHDMNRI